MLASHSVSLLGPELSEDAKRTPYWKSWVAHVRKSAGTRKLPHTGSERDLMQMWEAYYNEKGWAKIAPFDTKGKLGNAYIMFKHKYWKSLDNPKKLKARPVNPMCSHPMWTLFNAVGGAWMFVIDQWQAEHHILKDTLKVPQVLEDARR